MELEGKLIHCLKEEGSRRLAGVLCYSRDIFDRGLHAIHATGKARLGP